MKALTEFIARSLVEHPEEVRVEEFRRSNYVTLELHVARDDMGRIIGRNGRVANAIRSLLRVAAEREGLQVTLEVIEP